MTPILAELRNWLEPIGIIAGLVFSGLALRNDVRSRRLESKIKIIEGHRAIWAALLENPSLERVRSLRTDLEAEPVTPAENRFVRMLLQHVLLTYEALSSKQLQDIGEFDQDVKEFLSLPIPQFVWNEVARLQPPRFKEFVETLLKKS